jgi:hypothetical protein
MRRHAFGLIGILFLALAIVGLVYAGSGGAQRSMAASICMRVGLVLGAIWLAYPQLKQIVERVPAWMMVSVGLAVAVLVVRPRAILAIGPVLLVIFVLQFLGWLFRPLPNPKRSTTRKPTPTESRRDSAT